MIIGHIKGLGKLFSFKHSWYPKRSFKTRIRFGINSADEYKININSSCDLPQEGDEVSKRILFPPADDYQLIIRFISLPF